MNPSTGADVSLDDNRWGGQAMEGPAVARPRVLGTLPVPAASRTRAWLRAAAALVLLALLYREAGGGWARAAVAALDPRVLLLAAVLTAGSTGCVAWRWCLVSRRLGLRLTLPVALAACYRSQFLNTVLPGGVLGDVERGVRHGQEERATGRGLAAVAGDRAAGQAVQVLVAVVVLAVLPSPLRSLLPPTPVTLVIAVAAATLAGAVVVRSGGLRVAEAGAVVALSVAAVAGHLLTFLLAARAVGVGAPTRTVLPLVLLALVAMAVPLNLAGWGPREGVAAWAFAAAGLGATAGLQTAVAYGLLVLVACLPGAVVVMLGRGSSR